MTGMTSRTAAVNLLDSLFYTVLDFDYLTQKYKVRIEDRVGHLVAIEAWEDKEFIESCRIDVIKTLNNIEDNF